MIYSSEKLREAAARMVDPEDVGLNDSDDNPLPDFPPIAKRALAAIIENAFPAAPLRGATYAEEMADLGRWLGAVAGAELNSPCGTTWPMLLAAAGAAVADHHTPGDEVERLEVVRAIATYFLREKADLAANFLEETGQAGGAT